MKKLFRFLILSFSLTAALLTQAQVLVRRFAGDGPSTYYNAFSGVTVDGSGNVYTTDFYQNRIRKVTPNGVMTVFAGKGQNGNADGVGTDAEFGHLIGIDVDGFGNVYVADGGNNLIRKITPDGVVTTFAGSGKWGKADGIGILAEFAGPSGVTVDASGNVYVADTGNGLIRKITPDGQVTTFAGSGQSPMMNGVATEVTFATPTYLTVDATGNVYVTDDYYNLIRKITPEGIVTIFAGSGNQGKVDGPGTEASFYKPSGMAVDIDGNLYLADSYNNVIRKITPDGTVSTYAGTGVYGMKDGFATEAAFAYPTDVAIDASGNIYVSEYGNYLIRKITGKPVVTPPVTPTDPIATRVRSSNSIVEMKLYPIPASNQLTLSFNLTNESDIQVELINSEGNKVASKEISGTGYQEATLSVQSLPEGIYIANIYSGSQRSSQKVVILR